MFTTFYLKCCNCTGRLFDLHIGQNSYFKRCLTIHDRQTKKKDKKHLLVLKLK